MPENKKNQAQNEEPVTAYTILEAFGKYSKYDPAQKSFNAMSSEWVYHHAGEKITQVCDEFDPSGTLAALYAKRVYMNVISNSQVKLLEMLSDEAGYLEEKQMYDLMTGAEVAEMEKAYLDGLNDTIQKMTGKSMLGERDLEKEKEVLYAAVELVVDNLGKCHEEVYVNSGKPVQQPETISTKIHVFNYVSECVLRLQALAKDGVYLCYISNNGTADGYFAIMVKSNGNIFSVNDRVREAYIGQHTHSRNGRWAEGHKDIFPYDHAVEFSKHDYLGYASIYSINESNLDMRDMEASVFIPILLSILCVIKSRVGKTLEPAKQVYMNTLLKGNLTASGDAGTALITLDKTGLIDTTNKALEFHFDRDKFLNGEYDEKFTHYPKRDCKSISQLYVDKFGQDFEIPEKQLSVFTGSYLTSGKPEDNPNAEFVGSLEDMERQAYYEARVALAKHIEEKMKASLEAAGGEKALQQWFIDNMTANMHNLYPAIARMFERGLMFEQEHMDNNARQAVLDTLPRWERHIIWYGGEMSDYQCRPNYNSYDYKTGKYSCPITGSREIKYIAGFRAYDWTDIEAFTGQKIPDYLQYWVSDFYHDRTPGPTDYTRYEGNPLLDAVDAVDFVKPFDDRYTKFDFYIGFSRSGFKKLLKMYGSGSEPQK